MKAGKSLLEATDNKSGSNNIATGKIKSKADEIIDVYPQHTFIPNCQYDFPVGKYRVLSWNMVGTVCLREEFQFTSIDVDFTNKNFHRNLVLNDDYRACMAAMNYSGMILASKAQESDLDKYEDDEDDMEIDGDDKKNKKSSNIYFRPFSEWKTLKDWRFELKDGESVEGVAIGAGWCAAYTDFGYIRVFSSNGIQKYVFSVGSPLLTMVGYENILALVYHSGPPVYGF